MDRLIPRTSPGLPRAIRVWLDDPNPIFRMGLAAALRDPRFVVAGESSGLVPPPALDDVDVLVFDLGDEDDIGVNLSGRLAGLRRRRSTRLVGLVPGGEPDLSQASQCTILARSELTPEAFRDCLAAVVAGAAAPRPSRPPGPGRAAWRSPLANGGSRLRRLVTGRNLLVLAAGLLVASALGPTGRAQAEPTTAQAVTAVAETTPVQSPGDAAGGVAIWVNTVDPAASLVFGTDRQGALEMYDLTGARVQRLERHAGTTSTVDVRSGFLLRDRPITLVATGGRHMSFFRLEVNKRRLHEVTANSPGASPDSGLCLYRSPVSARFYAFVTEPAGDITQYELVDQGGSVNVRPVRTWPLPRPTRWCVADDETGRLFVSTGDGIWRYDAEPDASPVQRRQVDKPRGGHLAGAGGLAVVEQPGRRGLLLASSPNDSTFAVYQRGGEHSWVGQRQVVDGPQVDGCSGTGAIAAVTARLGARFPAGLFVCHDGRNTAPGPAGRQNFKYVRLERLLGATGAKA